jgi:hypothetical protein
MNSRYVAAGLLTFMCIILVLIHIENTQEDFSTKKDKAQAIVDWFNANPDPTYNKYKKDLFASSNIVEYEDSLALFQDRNLTVESAEKIL